MTWDKLWDETDPSRMDDFCANMVCLALNVGFWPVILYLRLRGKL